MNTESIRKVPFTIITGFLGSGKTTLVRHLMQNQQGKRLAFVLNEFGDVGVDGDILKSCVIPDCPAQNIMELANGCICCMVADDSIPTIEALMALDPQPEHILIETSGLALPKPLLKAFDWPDIRSRITIYGVIALADTEAVSAGPDGVEKAKQIILGHTPKPLPIAVVSEGSVDPRLVLGRVPRQIGSIPSPTKSKHGLI